MVREINFDMDGTLCDFYGVENWLNYLMNFDPTPYKVAKPLDKLKNLCYNVNVR